MIAKIAVDAANFAIDKSYSYFVPFGMHLLPGMRVQVPFGRGNRRLEGVVLSVSEGDQWLKAGGSLPGQRACPVGVYAPHGIVFAGTLFLYLLRCRKSHASRRLVVSNQRNLPTDGGSLLGK